MCKRLWNVGVLVVALVGAAGVLYAGKLHPRHSPKRCSTLQEEPSALQFDSLNVRFVGNWPFGYALAVAGDTARNLVFLGSGGGVYILDVSDPSNPVNLSEQEFRTRGVVSGVFYTDNKLYIAGGEAGIEIWDVATPTNPCKLGTCDTPGYARGVYVQGTYAYVTDGGLRVIDISDPTSPTEVGYYAPPGSAKGVYVQGTYAYVADDYAGLQVIDVSDPGSPTEVGYYDTPDWALGVYVQGAYAYVADGEAGLQIYEFLAVGVEEVAKAASKALCLRQNIPNPVCAFTKIAYEVPNGMHVSLKIYDVSGKLVNTLVNSYQKAGHHSVIWSGIAKNEKKVPNGVYFYRLETKNRCITKKLIVMR